MFRYLIRRLLWAMFAVLRRHDRHLRDLLRHAADPARARLRGERRDATASSARDREARPRQADAGAVRAVPEAARHRPDARHLVHDRQSVNAADHGGRTGDRVARLRRRHLLDAASRSRSGSSRRCRPRSLIDRAAMVFVLIGISAHPVWIGLIFAYFFGYKLGLDADHGLLRLLQPADTGQPRRPGAVGLPPDPALDDVRDPLRRALRADDPRERDGDAERGLRAHGARQGRARARR